MAFLWFSGAEANNRSEFENSSVSITVSTEQVRTGGYALKSVNSQIGRVDPAFSAITDVWVRCFLFLTAFPTTSNEVILCGRTPGPNNRVFLRMSTTGVLNWSISTATGASVASGSHAAVLNAWNLIEAHLKFDTTTGGIEAKLNSTIEFTSFGSNTNDGSAGFTTIQWGTQNSHATFYYDDLIVSNSGYPGAGQCVARQGTSGTPTYDGWIKVGSTAIESVWSDTPFSTGTNAHSSSAADQTMLVFSFATAQTGHGLQVISSDDTINACKAVIMAQTDVASTFAIRRRIGGVDTDTVRALTVTTTMYDDGLWTTTIPNLNSAEIGGSHKTGTAINTIMDAWLMVDYAPAVSTSGTGTVAARHSRSLLGVGV